MESEVSEGVTGVSSFICQSDRKHFINLRNSRPTSNRAQRTVSLLPNLAENAIDNMCTMQPAYTFNNVMPMGFFARCTCTDLHIVYYGGFFSTRLYVSYSLCRVWVYK